MFSNIFDYGLGVLLDFIKAHDFRLSDHHKFLKKTKSASYYMTAINEFIKMSSRSCVLT
jgi:hypothetical protein